MDSKSPQVFAGKNAPQGAATPDFEAAFEAMRAAFERAAERRPDHLFRTRHIFAGRPVLMRVVGPELAERMGRAFAHLRTDEPAGEPPELTIELWDEDAAGVPAPPAGPEEGGAKPLVAFEGGVFGGSADGRFVRYARDGAVTFLDRQGGRIVGCRPSGRGVSVDECAKPLACLLPVWHNDRGVLVAHGALVSRGGRGVLFAGSGGAGKSTAALACLRAGFRFVADDHVGLQRAQDGGFVGHSIYGSLRVASDHLRRFPDLPPQVIHRGEAEGDKPAIFLAEAFPGQFATSARVDAVALPRVAGGRASRTRPASKGKALLTLAYSTLMIPPSPAGALDTLAALIDGVPTFWLELGEDIEAIPGCVEDLLAGASRT